MPNLAEQSNSREDHLLDVSAVCRHFYCRFAAAAIRRIRPEEVDSHVLACTS
jgi:hypothetical protein